MHYFDLRSVEYETEAVTNAPRRLPWPHADYVKNHDHRCGTRSAADPVVIATDGPHATNAAAHPARSPGCIPDQVVYMNKVDQVERRRAAGDGGNGKSRELLSSYDYPGRPTCAVIPGSAWHQ